MSKWARVADLVLADEGWAGAFLQAVVMDAGDIPQERKMPHTLLNRFERRVLRPISFAHGALLIVLLFQGHFLIAGSMGVLWLLYGSVGQALHKDLSPRQLARGEHVSSAAGDELEPLSPQDSHQLGKAILGLGLILSVTTIIVAIHLGVRWFFALPLGILAWFLSPILSLVLAGGDVFLKAWRKRGIKEVP